MAHPVVTIDALSDYVGQTVTLRGWLYNKRGAKSLTFLIARDGTGLVQCVVNQAEVEAATWDAAESLGQEASLEVDGIVRTDERQVGGHEIQVAALRVLGASEDYPISPKEHGIDFLLNHRHLWLRSRRQWAIERVRPTT
jgi:asparaginyl-tRNA synthetase